MAPPTYSDLGKSAKDVFSKGYNFGLFKLECKSTTSGGVEINSGGTHSLEDGKVTGSLETKYKVPSYGKEILTNSTRSLASAVKSAFKPQ